LRNTGIKETSRVRRTMEEIFNVQIYLRRIRKVQAK
jgi:hypothetical protein